MITIATILPWFYDNSYWILSTWKLTPLRKWVTTPVTSRLVRVSPLFSMGLLPTYNPPTKWGAPYLANLVYKYYNYRLD